ncbi:MAG: hypothetical protein AABX59_02090, partial [Nanoarchaeota archaeon]
MEVSKIFAVVAALLLVSVSVFAVASQASQGGQAEAAGVSNEPFVYPYKQAASFSGSGYVVSDDGNEAEPISIVVRKKGEEYFYPYERTLPSVLPEAAPAYAKSEHKEELKATIAEVVQSTVEDEDSKNIWFGTMTIGSGNYKTASEYLLIGKEQEITCIKAPCFNKIEFTVIPIDEWPIETEKMVIDRIKLLI